MPSAPEDDRIDAPAARDAEALRAAFVDGLGSARLDLPALTPAFMESLGALVRAVTAGTMELLRVRSEGKSTLHAEMTRLEPRAINPLKAAWDAGVALEHLFAPRPLDMQDASGAVAEAYDNLRAHDRQLVAGIHAALASLVARFDPRVLEQRLGDETMLDSLVPGARKARQWDAFVEIYDDIRADAERDFWSLFEKELRAAGSGQHEHLPPRDSATGG